MKPKTPLWRAIQRQNFTDWRALFAFLELPEAFVSEIVTRPKFSLNLPLRLAEKIQKGTLHDPILKQFLPLAQELESGEAFVRDPVGDILARAEGKLLHKYEGRALLLCTSACAMHCRYCFRQHFDYQTEQKGFEKELEKIREDATLSEILLSGGDPLSLGNLALQELCADLEKIPHLRRLRIHTRFPIGIPERIDEEFLRLLKETRLQVVFVIHVNCAEELDADILAALRRVQRLGIPILSQSVLLRGVNDTVVALKRLCEELINAGILPYYLHQLDRVQGAMHFEVPEEEGLKLMRELTSLMPGYAVPRFVKEVPKHPSKLALY